MPSAEKSALGIAKQVGKGVPNTNDADFTYLLFINGGVAPNNVVIPLDPEVGGGALSRDVKKVGVTSGGAMEFIPRPASLGKLLLGAFGTVENDLVYKGALVAGDVLASGGYIFDPAVPSAVTIVADKAATGNVVFEGTDASDAAASDTIALNGTTPVTGVTVFKTITKITLPAVSGATITIKANPTGAHTHVFQLGPDQFAAPYFTLRSSPADMWGEQYQDCRVSALALAFKGADFVRGSVGFAGGLPTPVSKDTWNVAPKVDGGPQLIAPVSDIELPVSTNLKVLSGAITAGMAIPLDEQWIVGSYSPDDFDILSRSFALTYNVKITDAALYSKIMYDPAGGSAWATDMFREAAIKLDLVSDSKIGETNVPYRVQFRGNGLNGSKANVVWSAAPIAMRAGKQIVMTITGVFLADPMAGEPITAILTNDVASY